MLRSGQRGEHTFAEGFATARNRYLTCLPLVAKPGAGTVWMAADSAESFG